MNWKGIGGCQGNFLYVLEPQDYIDYLKKGMLKYIPENIILLFQKKIKPRIVFSFEKEGENTICGYAAGFFTTYKNLSKAEYLSRLTESINLLKTEDMKSLITERIHTFTQEDIKEIENNSGLKILDGRNEIINSIPYVLKELFRLKNQLINEKEILIISDDTYLTEKIAINIAKDLSFLTIMSKNMVFCEKLMNKILNETGLSLQLSTKLDKSVQNFDVVINMASDVELDAYNIKRRAIIVDTSLGRKLEILNDKRKDLLIITDLIFKNSGILKNNSELFSYKDKIPSYIYEGIKKQDNMKPIEIRANGKNYKIKDAVNIYYGKRRNKSLFLTK